jgi:hypothetical protein
VFRSERYEAVFAFFPQFRMVPRAFRSSPFATFFAPTSYSTDMTTDGFKLFVDNKMVIKGTNYSPVPIGAKPENPPYGDYFVLNYGNVWKPDLTMMRAAGINAIKLYAGNPHVNAGPPGSCAIGKPFLVVTVTRLGTASPALSLNPIMAQGSQISSERPLRPMMP